MKNMDICSGVETKKSACSKSISLQRWPASTVSQIPTTNVVPKVSNYCIGATQRSNLKVIPQRGPEFIYKTFAS